MPNEKVSHTPGPWELEKRECRSLGSVHYAIKTSYKCSEHPWSPRFIAWMAGSLGEIIPSRKPDDYRDDPGTEADAHLIAAAPEQHSWMWTALTALRYWRDSETNKDKYAELCKIISDGEDIYHKAEGR